MRRPTTPELAALALIVAVIVVAGASFGRTILTSEGRQSLTSNPLVQNFLPLYHALRKVPDVLFFPYYLRRSELPVLALELSLKDQEKLNAALPKNPFGLETLNSVEKVSVKAGLQTSDGYSDSVEIRYRGSIANNWNSRKRSIQIDFPKSHLYNGVKELSLFIPADREYFAEALDYYRAEKLGLKVPKLEFVRLMINNQDYGVYIASEHWSQEWLEKNKYSADSNILGANAGLETGGKFVWSSWNVAPAPVVKKPKSQVLTGVSADESDTTEVIVHNLTQIVEHASDKDFERYLSYVLDMKKFYAAQVVYIMSGTYHSDGYLSPENNPAINDVGDNNMVFVFNTDTGLLEPIPFNVAIGEIPEGGIVEIPSYMTRRMYSIPSFLAARNALLEEYLSDPKNHADDTAFIDAWQKKIQPDVYTDSVKLENNFEAKKTIEMYRRWTDINFERARAELSRTYDRPEVDVRPLSFRGSFIFLPQTAITPAQFVASHPEFYLSDGQVHLSSGPHYFTKTTTVPKGTRLVIDPGARLYFAKDVTFVSYSPVTAKGGTAGISMLPSSDSPWGNFVVANAGRAISYFDRVYLKGGGDTHINGAHFSGTLSLQDSDAEIMHVTVEEAQGDDGIHIAHGNYTISGSTFRNNWADPIDSDFTNSTIEDNTFINTVPVSTLSYDGDAMDVSGSTVIIRGNRVYGMGDKGISVGEGSEVVAEGNIITGSVFGTAVKDRSRAILKDNIYVKNKTAIALYEKKAMWGGGTATSTGSIFFGNEKTTSVDKNSTFVEEGSIIATAVEIVAKLPPILQSFLRIPNR